MVAPEEQRSRSRATNKTTDFSFRPGPARTIVSVTRSGFGWSGDRKEYPIRNINFGFRGRAAACSQR